MIRIRRLTLCEVHLPLRRPFVTSGDVRTHRRVLLLHLEEASGLSVWSECVAPESPAYTGETVDTAWMALSRWMAPLVLQRPFPGASAIYRHIIRRVRGHPMALAALEMGCWALEALQQNVSLAARLGAARQEIPAGVVLGITEDLGALEAATEEALARGYHRLKLKIRPGWDVQPLAHLRARFGAIPLGADANQAYTPDDREVLQRLDALDLEVLEQPLEARALVPLADLQRALRTPLGLDESLMTVEDARTIHTLGSGRKLNVKPGRMGGFTPALEVHDLARRWGLPLWCGGMLETGIGRAYSVALAALPGFTEPADLSESRRYWEEDLVDPPWTLTPGGGLQVPQAPGIGVTVDEARVARHTVRRLLLE